VSSLRQRADERRANRLPLCPRNFRKAPSSRCARHRPWRARCRGRRWPRLVKAHGVRCWFAWQSPELSVAGGVFPGFQAKSQCTFEVHCHLVQHFKGAYQLAQVHSVVYAHLLRGLAAQRGATTGFVLSIFPGATQPFGASHQ
jgi:hypothetical protein